MTESKKFKQWMKVLSLTFIVLFLYIIIADRNAPLTTEGRVHGHVVQIAPEVSSRVTEVMIRNNDHVGKGDILFKLDPRQFEIALDKAELSLKSAKEKEIALHAQKSAAIANITRAKASLDNALSEYNRIVTLSKQQAVSRSTLDEVTKHYQVATAALEIERQNLKVLQAQLGRGEGTTTDVRLAKNQVEKAKLDLEKTYVRSPSDGVVTNLRLEVGTAASANMPLLTFVSSGSLWVAADFREKSVTRVNDDYKALVTFDAYPGRVFQYDVDSRDHGVSSGQQTPNGTLTEIQVNNRWVRDAQRTRINLDNDETLPSSLFVGSRATMVLHSGNNAFWQAVAKLRIRMVSLFHFIY
ncbi:HlyD family secretion protein [Vibrio sp. ZSDE26]|uniref:HlyD family secretion protein n=1 Tax=Vibrio amylolyticus TaxID=2847292 RepID=A0A9X2BHX3_9VIBR|nr:HlyD family secretion protein [Vibrio amylolyticus]MCK6263480.1 HlyD family secretion protein [Vibrio amylolyticus]